LYNFSYFLTALIGFVLRRKNYEKLFDDGKPLPKAGRSMIRVNDSVQFMMHNLYAEWTDKDPCYYRHTLVLHYTIFIVL